MTLDLNDPRLTAYALGELDDVEHAAIEAEVTRDGTLRRAVADIRAAADLLTAEFQKEPVMRLTEPQRTAISQAAETGNPLPIPTVAPPRSWYRTYKLPLGIAASVAVLIGGASLLLPTLSAVRMAAPHSMLAEAKLRAMSPAPIETHPIRGKNLKGIGVAGPLVKGELAARDAEKRYYGLGLADAPQAPQSSVDGVAKRKETVVAERLPKSEQSSQELGLQQGRAGRRAERSVHHVAVASTPSLDEQSLRRRGHLKQPEFARRKTGGHGVPDAYDSTVESYAPITENPFFVVTQNALSTFSIDVDTASYSNVRRFLNGGSLPPPGAVRIEELINYFEYDYPQPADEHPFSVNVEVGSCPWKEDHYLARVGLKGYEVSANERPAANLVFLIDVSGSMQSANRLPLVKEGLKLLVGQLTARDRVAMVVYAGASGLVLPSTYCSSRGAIVAALDQLQAGGSTNGGAGIQLAYDTADANFIEGGVNRVILATDGDFNVGITSQDQLTQLIQDQAKTGVFLSVLGFGMGNLKDSTLETLADKGNGNYAYIDTLEEAKKVLVDEIGGTLVTIAKDVKIQIEFNPRAVSAYRLIGYENRVLAAQDFNDDRKDAGEIGAGHTVTALYELVPVGAEMDVPSIDPLKYQTPTDVAEAANDHELMTVKLRYKEPDEEESKLIEAPVSNPYSESRARIRRAPQSVDFQFASAVAAFGMLLRGSEYAGDATYDTVLTLAGQGLGQDRSGYRAEFIQLVQQARSLNAAADR